MWIPWTLTFHTNLLPSEQNQKLIALIHGFLSKAYCLDSTTKKWNPVQICWAYPPGNDHISQTKKPKRNFESINFPNFSTGGICFRSLECISFCSWITSSRWLPEPPGSERRWVSPGSGIEGWSRRILKQSSFLWWDDGTVGLITARLVSFLGLVGTQNWLQLRKLTAFEPKNHPNTKVRMPNKWCDDTTSIVAFWDSTVPNHTQHIYTTIN